MSGGDESLRAGARAWGAGEAGPAGSWLRDRLRRGDLSPERLALAAYLGESAAREALGEDAPRAYERLDLCLRGLPRFGGEVCLRAAVEVCRALVRAHDLGGPFRRALGRLERAVEEVALGQGDGADLWEFARLLSEDESICYARGPRRVCGEAFASALRLAGLVYDEEAQRLWGECLEGLGVQAGLAVPAAEVRESLRVGLGAFALGS